VWIRDTTHAARHALARRLSARVGREVQAVDVRDARTQPSLLESILREGRVLVDRAGCWPALASSTAGLRRRATRERRILAERAAAARDFFISAAQ